MFDYSKLLGKIKTCFKTQGNFAKEMGMSLSAVNSRLNNKIDWTPEEMIKACELLFIPLEEIYLYFFVEKV